VTAWVKKAQTNNVNEAGNGEWKMGARGRDGLTSARRVRRGPSPGWVAGQALGRWLARLAEVRLMLGRGECGSFGKALMRGQPAEGTFRKLSLSPRRGTPVSEDSRRWNGARWKGQPVERFTGGAEMERNGDALNWRSHASKAADVSLRNWEDQARRKENRNRRILL
jgi:hypothetical protein